MDFDEACSDTDWCACEGCFDLNYGDVVDDYEAHIDESLKGTLSFMFNPYSDEDDRFWDRPRWQFRVRRFTKRVWRAVHYHELRRPKHC